VTFDNAGVAGSTGTTPSTIARTARDADAPHNLLAIDGPPGAGTRITAEIPVRAAGER
jgi:hypothetical protein